MREVKDILMDPWTCFCACVCVCHAMQFLLNPYFIQLPVIILPNLHTPLSLCRPLQSVDTVCTLYQSFQEGTGSDPGGLMDDTKEPPARQGGELGSGPTRDATLLRPCPKHMSATERLRKVIQELVDTEKSYVKVRRRSFDCCHIWISYKKITWIFDKTLFHCPIFFCSSVVELFFIFYTETKEAP